MFGAEVDLEGNITDLGYQIVFRASKFLKSLGRRLVMQVARCRTLIFQADHVIHMELVWLIVE